MSRIDEYYVIRLTRKSRQRPSLEAAEHDIYVNSEGKPGRIDQALTFSSIDACEHYLQQQPASAQMFYHIQLCSSLHRDSAEYSQLTARLMEIPYPYRRSAYNWYRGKDVERLLRSEADEVYDRHRKLLLQYDIDIALPSAVVLFSTRKKVSAKPHHDRLPNNAPRQFVCAAPLRPSKKTD